MQDIIEEERDLRVEYEQYNLRTDNLDPQEKETLDGIMRKDKMILNVMWCYERCLDLGMAENPESIYGYRIEKVGSMDDINFEDGLVALGKINKGNSHFLFNPEVRFSQRVNDYIVKGDMLSKGNVEKSLKKNMALPIDYTGELIAIYDSHNGGVVL